MNYQHDCARGRRVIGEPVSRAEMDLIAGLSNCPLDVLNPCNGYNCTPVKIEVCTVA